MIKEVDNTIKGHTIFRDIIIEINRKKISIEVEQTSDEYAPVTGTNYDFIHGEELLSDEEKDEIDDFIRENY